MLTTEWDQAVARQSYNYVRSSVAKEHQPRSQVLSSHRLETLGSRLIERFQKNYPESTAICRFPSAAVTVCMTVSCLAENSSIKVLLNQEKMRGQRGRLPVKPLGYVICTKVIFRRVEVFVLAEVCLPRRLQVGQPRSDV